MARNSENIEAKLAAYIDGDLDEADREEIEKYLQTNPNHRRLLAELGRTHGLLRDLPRETAPPEILDEFNSQLERSALLNSPDEPESDVLRRINRRPQVLSLAAIILLTVGLGVVLYLVLLPAQPPTYTTTGDRPRTRPSAPLAATPSNEPATAGDADQRLAAERSAEDALASAKQTRPPTLTERAAAPKDEATDLAPPVPSSERDFTLALQDQLDQLGPIANPNTFVVLVETDDTTATQDQVLSFLSVNGIEFEPILAAAPAIAAPAQVPPAPAPSAARTDATTAPAEASASTPADASQPPAAPSETPADVPAPDSPAQPVSERAILARNLTVTQASTFTRALPQWRDGQQVQVYRIEQLPAEPTLDQPAQPADIVQHPEPAYPHERSPSPARQRLVRATPTVQAWVEQDAIPATQPAAPVPTEAENAASLGAHPAPSTQSATDVPGAERARTAPPITEPASPPAPADAPDAPSEPAGPDNLAQESAPATRPQGVAVGDWLSITVHPADKPARVYVVQVTEHHQIHLPEIGLHTLDPDQAPEDLARQLTLAYRQAGTVLARAVQVERTAAPEPSNPSTTQPAAQQRVDLLIYVAGSEPQEPDPQPTSQPAAAEDSPPVPQDGN